MLHLGGSMPFCGPGTFHALPLSHSPPPNLLYLLKRKALPILFQPVKTFGEKRASARTIKHRAPFDPVDATGFFAPKINNMEVIFL